MKKVNWLTYHILITLILIVIEYLRIQLQFFLTGSEYKYPESNVKGVIPVKHVKLSFINLLYNIYLVFYIKHIDLIN